MPPDPRNQPFRELVLQTIPLQDMEFIIDNFLSIRKYYETKSFVKEFIDTHEIFSVLNKSWSEPDKIKQELILLRFFNNKISLKDL